MKYSCTACLSELYYFSSWQWSLVVDYVLEVASVGWDLHCIHQSHIDVHLLDHHNKEVELLICSWFLCPYRKRQYLGVVKSCGAIFPS